MKKLLVIPLLAATVFFMASCNKEDDKKQTRKELMVGTWNLNAAGVDDNMNGRLDVAEYDTIPAGVNLTQTYRADGTGVFTTRVPNEPDKAENISWTLTDGDKNLKVTTTNAVTNATIVELNSTTLEGYDVSVNPRFIFILKK